MVSQLAQQPVSEHTTYQLEYTTKWTVVLRYELLSATDYHTENIRVARNWHGKTFETTLAKGLTDGIYPIY